MSEPQGRIVDVEFPSVHKKLLFSQSRYKVLYGGRGGAKSWAIARALLALGIARRLRILCARETMQSISDSVHKLLADQVEALGLAGHYQVLKSAIVGINGTEFAFAGLRHNVAQIKSYESFDIAWVEEAQSVSKASWEVLIPTIRKPDSEIWISFNPELASDDTFRRFITSPPPGCKPVMVSFRDNPWFPDVLKAEMEHLKATDPDAYNHVWEGMCIQTVEGAIYAAELAAAEKEKRITRVPYDATRPVQTIWDLGFGDETAIWFLQLYPFEYHLIDYLEGSRQPLPYYLKALQAKQYVYGTDYLPHDAQAKQLGSGKSIEELMRAAGRKVHIVPKLAVADGINAARTVFPQCWFDSEKCADGLQALRHYRWAPVGNMGQIKREPLHDWASNGADAFRYLAVGVRRQPAATKPAVDPRSFYQTSNYTSPWL
jgi:phage terminase large subunit